MDFKSIDQTKLAGLKSAAAKNAPKCSSIVPVGRDMGVRVCKT